MKRQWLTEVIETIAERGRELLGLDSSHDEIDLEGLCQRLLSGHGEASAIALSQELLRCYAKLQPDDRLRFFRMLEEKFGPNPELIQQAADRYLQSRSTEDLLKLNEVVEPPRQELIRRINMAPSGTASLVAMRADLLGFLRKHHELKAVDADLRHLLTSWFNRGFLQLRSIDWQSPAHILEKLISYEAVHEIHGWDDLRRRLMKDRRCFAFFHPAMNDEPLIFVEVALVKGMSKEVDSLVDPHAEQLDPQQADTAIFYSINNTQLGLRGISFGNFLIKQVLNELTAEFPAIKCTATLSPLPLFAVTLDDALQGNEQYFTRAEIDLLLDDYKTELCQASAATSVCGALQQLLAGDVDKNREVLARPLNLLALAYLSLATNRHASLRDPVATFHLSNGACIERLNPFADTSAHGMKNSYGMMVNYLYDTAKVESNHERFASQGEIIMSDEVAKLYRKIAALRNQQ